jgi:LmbE family N-acetylglucosaminyl deacetylase
MNPRSVRFRRAGTLAAVAIASTVLFACERDLPVQPGATPPAPRLSGAAGAAAMDVYVHAHPDDWSLFMGDRVAASVAAGVPVVLVYTTAGDGGHSSGYWLARERAAEAGMDTLLGTGTTPWPCTVETVAGHALRRCARGGVTSYTLRLPDGNSGDGFGYGLGSLKALRSSGTALAALDGSTTYTSWADLAGTLRAIVDAEATAAGAASVHLHAPDWDRAANPGDHPDHWLTGEAARDARTGRSWASSWYVGYDLSNRAANLDSALVAAKEAAFTAYDRSMEAAGAGSVAAAAGYQVWLRRTVFRTEEPPLVPVPGTAAFSTDFSPYTVGTQPAGWDQVWDATPLWKIASEPGATGGKVLEWSGTGQSRNRWGLAYGGFGDVADQAVYTELRVRTLGGGYPVSYMGTAAVRMGGEADDEHGYAVFLVDNQGTRSVVLATWSQGGYTQLQDYPLAWSLDTWYALRLEAAGSRIRARIWPRGTPEPGGWPLDVTDTRYATGRPGVSNHDNGTVQWDVWSVDVTQAPPPSAPPPGQSWATGFDEGTAWTLPAGWTPTSAPGGITWTVAADLSVPDGRVLRGTATTTGRHILRWDSVADTTSAQEGLVRFRLGDGDERGPGIALRHTMNGTQETAYVAYLRTGPKQVEINRFLSGGWAYVGSTTFDCVPGTWYWMRFRAEGSSLRVRVWADGSAEPSAWTLQGNDAGISAGSAGLYVYEPNIVDFDAFSAATGGVTAPTPPGATTTPAIAQVVVTPASASVGAGGQQTFAAYGRLANGDSVPAAVTWSATGGPVSAAGVYTAGSTAGSFAVTATLQGGSVSGTAAVTVTAAPPPPPSTFWASTFATGATGAAPAGWTATSAPANVTWTVEADTSAADGRVLRAVATSTARHILRADSIPPGTGDQEALVRIRMGDADGRGPGIALRHTMNGSVETAYVIYLRSDAAELEMDRFLSGGWAWLNATHFASTPGTWYWMRFRAEGSTLKARVWADGTAEPTAWMVTATDAAIPTGGMGVYVYEPNTVSFDAFSGVAGPGSAPAP